VTDIVDKATRSRMMSGIRGKNTKPELLIRSLLHRSGFRFRLHRKDLPGNPDIVLKKHKAAILVQGCFWHMHHCPAFKMPKTRTTFWNNKLVGNYNRDQENVAALISLGWRVAIVWECALKHSDQLKIQKSFDSLLSWVKSSRNYMEIPRETS